MGRLGGGARRAGDEALLTRDVVVLLGASFCYIAGLVLVNPLVAGLASSLGAAAVLTGALAALSNACSLLARPVAGNLAGLLSRRRLVCAGAALMCLAALCQACAPGVGVLAVARLASGVGYSVCSVGMSTWLAERLPPARLGQGMGLFGLMNALAMAVGPATGIAVSGLLGVRAAFVVSAALAATAVLGALLVRGGESGEGLRPGGRRRARVLEARALPAAVTIALFTLPYMATQSFLVSYVEARGLDVPTGAFFTLYALFLMALRVCLGRAFDSVPFSRFLVLSAASQLGSLALLWVMRGPVELLLAAPLMAGGYGVMCSVCQAAAVRAAGDGGAGMANGTYYMGLDAGMTLGSVAGGALLRSVGPAWFYPALMLAPLAALLVLPASRRLEGRG